MPFIPEDIYQKLTSLNCEDVASRLGIAVSKHKCKCFMHSDAHPSLSFFKKGRVAWNCFVCNVGGNAVNLVMRYYDIDRYSACLWLCSEYGLSVPDTLIPRIHYKLRVYEDDSDDDKQEDEKSFDSELAQCILDLSPISEAAKKFLLDTRLLSKEVVESLGIGTISDSRLLVNRLFEKFGAERLVDSGLVKKNGDKLYLRVWSPCLLFPYKDIYGNLIGLQSRYLGSNTKAPRFQFLLNTKTHIFNLPCLFGLRRDETVYISEGITDCLSLLSCGKTAVAIPSASILPVSEFGFLRGLNVVIVPDNDDAGARASVQLQSKLKEFVNSFQSFKLPEKYKDFSNYFIECNKRMEDPVAPLEIKGCYDLTVRQFLDRIIKWIELQLMKRSDVSDTDYSLEIAFSVFTLLLQTFDLKEQELKKNGIVAFGDVDSIFKKDCLIKIFCLWLASSGFGHYNISYYNQRRYEFLRFIGVLLNRIDVIVKIVNCVSRESWVSLRTRKMFLVFDDIIKIKFLGEAHFKVELNLTKISEVFSIKRDEVRISGYRQDYRVPEFNLKESVMASDKDKENTAKQVNDLVGKIVNFSDYGEICHG